MIFIENTAYDDRTKIARALADIGRVGDSFQRFLAAFIKNSDLNVFVGPVSVVRGSGSVALEDPFSTRDAVLGSNLDLNEAGRFVRLSIARETIDDGGQRGIEGTLVHEGKHALDFAKMISRFSTRGTATAFIPTAYQREYSAHLTSALYLLRRGGEFADEGLSLGILRRNNGRFSVNPEGIRDRLLNNYGLSPDSQGATLDSAADPRLAAI